MAQKTFRSFGGLSVTSPRFLDRVLRRWPHQSSTVWRRRPNAKPTRNVFVSKNGSAVRKRADEKLSNGVCKRKPCVNLKMSVFANRNENEPKKPNAKPTMRIEGASTKRGAVRRKQSSSAVWNHGKSLRRHRSRLQAVQNYWKKFRRD